ncbi:TetR/AcrR family transcriptional regulator [Pseudoroseicyclus sp. CXY001]|uniref:TetR/AcrR family transcriptional regulator n=1 Tax=Pseudoroseicyclus sp. CXY001 TaxID=3242492 RepID=UPI00358DD488
MTQTPDLRAALIDAGLAILEERGLAALTLRACAARAGVSHAAPAHHFAGLPGLRAAIAAIGFRRFAAEMLAERARAGEEPRARLVAICRGYLTFAERHPGLFHLIFNSSLPMADDPELSEAGDAAFEVLREGCAPFAPVGDTAMSTEAFVWSLIHGRATLGLACRFGEPEPHRPEPPDLAAMLGILTLR